jgi:hypothetical protein
MLSFELGSKELMDRVESTQPADNSLLDVVVIISRVLAAGRRDRMSSTRSSIVFVAGVGTDRVEGSPRPGKDVMRTLTMDFEEVLSCSREFTILPRIESRAGLRRRDFETTRLCD